MKAHPDAFPRDLGVILVDHGSTHDGANQLLEDIAQTFGRVAGAQIVEPAHMELAEPTLSQAFTACISRGARRIVVHPWFLAPGRHSTRDIPRLAEEAARPYPEVPYTVTDPLGLDTRLIDVAADRVRAALDKTTARI